MVEIDIEQYKVTDEKHEIAYEYEQMEKLCKEQGLEIKYMVFGKDAWHTVYDFPNGYNVSMLFLPHNKDLQLNDWTFELYITQKDTEGHRIIRKDNLEETLKEIEKIYNKSE